jgi:hypothetical protein
MIYKELLTKAIRSIKRADHLTYMTLPLVKDNKLILSILSNIELSLTQGMDALLEYERDYKRIPPLPQNFHSRYELFRDKLINKYDITTMEVELIVTLKNTIEAHKNSPIEFSRPDKFVICSENYGMKSISVVEIKKYISISKGFLRKIESNLK